MLCPRYCFWLIKHIRARNSLIPPKWPRHSQSFNGHTNNAFSKICQCTLHVFCGCVPSGRRPKKVIKSKCTLSLTFLFEREVLCEVPALVVPSQEKECSGVVDLKRPEVEHTLREKEGFGGYRWREGQNKELYRNLAITNV